MVKGEFIGGCDIVKEMFEKGELKELFQNKNLIKWDSIYKIIIAVVAIIGFEFTIGKEISRINEKIDIFGS